MSAAKASGKEALTPLELEIMQVLWTKGPSTAAEVLPELTGELAYNTVQTMLQVLLRKGKVKRVAEGRAYRYKPVVTQQRAAGSAVSDLLKRMFGGSAEAMLLAMVNARQLSAEDLQRAHEALAEAEKQRSSASGGDKQAEEVRR